MIKKFDVVIVGAGPAGLVAGILLCRANYSVAILEKRMGVEARICGEYLCPKGRELLEDLALDSELLAGFHDLQGMRLVSPRGDIVSCYFPEQKTGVALQRTVFEERLVAIFKREQGEIFFNQEVQSIDVRDNFVRAISREIECEGKWVIAADGKNSRVLQLLRGHHQRGLLGHQAALHALVPVKTGEQKVMGEMHILSGGRYIGINPNFPKLANFSLILPTKDLKGKRPLALINQAIQSSPVLSADYHLLSHDKEVKAVYPVHLINPCCYQSRVAFIGDAAGLSGPLTGEGIFKALSSATLLVNAIKKLGLNDLAGKKYEQDHRRAFATKDRIGLIFNILIKSTLFCRWMARFLNSGPNRASAFIGIIGNIYRPREGFIKMLWRKSGV